MVITVTIPPAARHPKIMSGIDLFNFTLNTKAASGPLQPPTSGIGMAVRIKTANSPHFSNFFAPCLRVCSKSHSKNL